MLRELVIKDFAIIDSLNLQFKKGLNILSGETGAGKSIIVGAVSLLLGGRASSDLIRSEKEDAVVEAVFEIGNLPEVKKFILSCGIQTDDDQLILRRVISKNGKNKIYIDGQLGNIQMLSRIGGALIDISGQYSQQLLLQTERHISIVDTFGELDSVCSGFTDLYNDFHTDLNTYNSLLQKEKDLKNKRDLYTFQNDELTKAALCPGEEEDLLNEKNILANAKDLYDKTYGFYVQMYANDDSCISEIKNACKKIEEASEIDSALNTHRKNLESIIIDLEESAQELRSYSDKINVDPVKLEQIEERLDVLYRLKSKYGMSIDELIQYQEKIKSDLNRIETYSEDLKVIIADLKKKSDRLWCLSDTISEKRRKSSEKLKKQIEKELESIGMGKTDFHIDIKSSAKVIHENPEDYIKGLTVTGKDEIEFFISPNKGEEKKPLSKIASGGELSRIVLAIKKIMAEKYLIPTLLFDEVDTGIGGAVAESVGTKLNEIARSHQVLCITHLPQIACFGDTHFNVTKNADKNRTVTKVDLLDEDKRIDEISRMLGGKNITDKTVAHAVEMLKNAQSY